MEHVAIDLGGTESQICVRSSDGTIIEETRWATRSLGRYLKGRPPSRVIVETSAEAFAVADQAKALGHEVRVVPSTLAKPLGIGARRIKNDRRDAQVLSEVSTRIDLPSVHVSLSRNLQRRQWRVCAAKTARATERSPKSTPGACKLESRIQSVRCASR